MMAKVFGQITMSLDGFAAGLHDSAANPLGDRGLELHQWLLAAEAKRSKCDRDVALEMFERTGAFVIGRRMADVGIPNWGDDGAFGMPVFIVTHRPAPALVKGKTTFAFVTDGLDAALSAALVAADGRDVCIAGGADVLRQALAAGLLNELRLDIAPVLLGTGVPLFAALPTGARFYPSRTCHSPLATHVTYTVSY